MIEDQNVHPGTVYLRTGESVRDRFGPDVEILAVRRPRRDDGPDPYRPVPVDEGFIRLREDRPTEQRNGLAEEGFLRLREGTVARPGPSAFANHARPPFDDYRTRDLPQFRPTDFPGQTMYVRRAERPPQLISHIMGLDMNALRESESREVSSANFRRLYMTERHSNIINTIHHR
ncbi:hypothetical protein ColLi_05199 [Colletotrichum liriopes]|uniref:Uncharacterized protein n=1 Tax=Colletotrichum liriopes TaxID=708192 RepID=A0AA37LS89_9PEZI|nr:hypothetical protein ColLi_05199 [Colletotrichum liriopes]